MKEKINKNSDRRIESISIKDGCVEKTDEFWSAESLRRRPINEQYPRLENETDSQYEDRLQEIQTLTDLAQVDLSEKDKREIEDGAYTEKSGKTITPNYRKFGLIALRAFDMAIKNPDLFHSDEGKFGLERQQAQEKKADYYIKLLQKNQPDLTEFSGLVSDEDLASDQLALQGKRGKIDNRNVRKSEERLEKDSRMETWDRVAEAVLYPLALNFGLFDNSMISSGDGSSGKYRARAIYPSKFDDQFHGVDVAFMVPTGVNKQGEIEYVPISFDCTTSINHLRVNNKFNKIDNDGRTCIKYAKTEDDDLVTDVHPLNFIIGIEHASLIGNYGLMNEDNIAHAPKAFIHDIYVQIFIQARLRADYYQLLRRERDESKNLVDVLSKDELKNMRQVIAVRDFFGQKCKETATNKERSFVLSRAYDENSPVSLVVNKASDLLRTQRRSIENTKK